jgi:hypothetical protein
MLFCDLFFSSSSLYAQFTETESNDTKGTANSVTVTGTGGYTINGTATGSDIDYYKITLPVAASGIYENILTLTTTGTPGHTVFIRGLNPDTGAPNFADWTVQTSVTGTTPPPDRSVKWYSFGKQEELYISVSGTASTSNYTLTWTRTTETVNASTNIFVNSLSDLIAWSYSDPSGIPDTDLWIYDSNFNPISNFGNDDQPSSSQSRLERAYSSSGDYYVAFSSFDLVNDQVSATDDASPLGIMLDFPGAVIGTSNVVFPGSITLNFSVNGGSETPVTFSSPPGIFNVVFVKFTISFAVTPVSLLSFSGYREGSHNLLKWSTASEQDNKGFQIERSTDGINYSSIGFVNSRSVNGNSASLLHYTFNDNNLQGSKQYYRLKQSDIDGRETLSNIILIKGQLPTSLTLSGLFPNPANNIISIIVDAPDGNEVELMITDMNGRLIKRQSAAVEAGTNTIPVDISKLTNGIYAVKLNCKSTCETVTGKFIKQ